MTSKIKKGNQQLIMSHPFYASLLFSLPLIEDKTIETACTDGTCVRYNPDFTESMGVAENTCLLAHEIYHVMLLHHTRRGGRDVKKWNYACDYAINPLLVKEGFTLPDGGLLEPAYEGMTAEQIYDMLPDGDNGDGQGNGGSGFGDVADYPELDETSKEEHEAQVRQNVAKASNVAQKQAGELPDHLKRLVEQVLNPKLPWQEILARFITASVKDDYSWTMPNSRYLHMGTYLPSLKSETLQEGVYAGDTSGSMDEKEITEEVAEIKNLCDMFKQKLTVIWTDSEVSGVQELEAFSEDEVIPVGGGGTKYSPTFDYIEKEGLNPAWVVYHTDGQCNDYPAVEPEYPVIWICTEENFNPPFGEVIYKNS